MGWVTATTGVMVSVPLCSGVHVAIDAMVTVGGGWHCPLMMMMMMLEGVKVLLLSCLLVPLSRRYVGWRSRRLRPPAG